MAKRKAADGENAPTKDKADMEGDSDSEGDDDAEMLDVEFEYFDPSPEVDFQGLKMLLRQLFDVDNKLFDLSELADMILAQPLLGSTIKCDGMESDPYAFLTVLNMHEHRDKAVIQEFSKYILQQSTVNAAMHKLLSDLLATGSKARVGLILAERFINMPNETIPPMYRMLLEEIQWANDEKEPYEFTHYLIVSKTYREIPSELGSENDRPRKFVRKDGPVEPEGNYFHPEDQVWDQHAMASCNYEFVKADEVPADSKLVFQDMGLLPQGHLILIEASKFGAAVQAVGEMIASAPESQ